MVGETVGHYYIEEQLGAGGMGVVYRARDCRLERTVALKLIGKSQADESAQARLLREARTASALNHPYICTIYEVGQADDRLYIAMEYVEGRLLKALIPGDGLPPESMLRYGKQIAEAIAHAHERGVIHRDLKSSNVIVRPDGRVKVLDFGLAKRLPKDAGQATLSEVSVAEAGSISGTLQYLPPEAFAGEPADPRSDIWALGVLLYEMAAGRLPFSGQTVFQLSSAILRDPVRPPPATVSAIVGAVILRCLAKEPAQRYQRAGELLAALEAAEFHGAALAAPMEGARTPPGSKRLHRWKYLWTILALAVPVVFLVPVFLQNRLQKSSGQTAGSPAPHRAASSPAVPAMYETELVRLTNLPGLEDEVSWAPDGRGFLYVSDEGGTLGIWRGGLSGQPATRLSPLGDTEAQPAWSPDGKWIAFISPSQPGARLGIFLGSRPVEMYVYGQDGDLFLRLAVGGARRKLVDGAYDPAWSPDGKQIAFRSIRDGAWRLWTVSIEDGKMAPIAGVEPRALAPTWSPDGKWIAYVAGASAATGWDLYVVPAAGGRPVALTRDRAGIMLKPAWSHDGRWVLFSSNRGGAVTLWRVPFDDSQPAVTERPQRLTTGIGEDVNAAVAPDGLTIAYAAVNTAPDIWEFDVKLRVLTQRTSETTMEDYPRLAPDGRRLLFYSDRSGREELWMLDLVSKGLVQLSQGGGTQNAWAPDGQKVAYGTPQGLRILDLPSRKTAAVAPHLSVAYPAFSRDGQWIAFQGRDQVGYRLYRVSAGGGEPSVIPTPLGEPGNPCWSPDGVSLYYQLDQLGTRNIWSVELKHGVSRQITSGDLDDAHPDVSRDGRTLLFLRNHRDLYTVPVEGGAPQLLYSVREQNRVVEFPAWTADNRRVVFSLARKTGDLFLLQPLKKQ